MWPRSKALPRSSKRARGSSNLEFKTPIVVPLWADSGAHFLWPEQHRTIGSRSNTNSTESTWSAMKLKICGRPNDCNEYKKRFEVCGYNAPKTGWVPSYP